MFEWFKSTEIKGNFSESGHFKEREVHEVVNGFSVIGFWDEKKMHTLLYSEGNFYLGDA